MKLKIIMVLVVCLGIGSGFYVKYSHWKKMEESAVPECPQLLSNSSAFESPDSKRCITRFANKGEQFNLKHHEALQRVKSLFKRNIEDQKVRPNDFNIFVNASEGNRKLRKYDPRLDIFKRFNVRDFVKKNETIKDYSLYRKKIVTAKTALKRLSCLKPQLSKIRVIEGLEIFKFLKSGKYKNPISKQGRFERANFSALLETQKQMGWYMYFIYNQNSIANFLLANHCNQTIALVLNHCIVNPGLDMQLEEIFWFEATDSLGINIYCKKSNEKSWMLMDSKVLEAK